MPKKRPRRKRIRKMLLIGLIVLIIVVPPVIWFVSYGLANKPLIDFTFGGATDIRLNYGLKAMNVTQPGTIDIINVLIRNRGPTEISVIVTLHAENALVSPNYGGPYNLMASDQIVALANGEFRYVTFYLTLRTQVPSFTVWCDVTRIIDYSTVTSSMATTFAEIKPIAPILLVYTQSSSNPNGYQLAQ